jgi:hypothetical protein
LTTKLVRTPRSGHSRFRGAAVAQSAANNILRKQSAYDPTPS